MALFDDFDISGTTPFSEIMGEIDKRTGFLGAPQDSFTLIKYIPFGDTFDSTPGVTAPWGMCMGPFAGSNNINLWVCNTTANTITVHDPTPGDAVLLNTYTVPTGSASPSVIKLGPDNNFWITCQGSNKIARTNSYRNFY